MRNRSIWRLVSAALVIAVGIKVVWGMLLLWSITLVLTPIGYTGYTDGIREDLTVLADGTPVIASRSVLRYEDVSYRTLDGESISINVNPQEFLIGVGLSAPYRPPGVYYPHVGWGQVMSASDYARPANGWYLIRDNEPHGRAYFVGYDELSRRPIGYISRQGFRRSLPPIEDWFDLGMDQLGWVSPIVASTGYLQYSAKAYHQPSYATDNQLPPWLVFLIDGDRLLEIDLQQRSLRTLVTADNLVSVGILRQQVPGQNRDDSERTTADGALRLQPRVALRQSDRMTLVDPENGAVEKFVLSESLRDEMLTVYSVDDGKLLVAWTPRDEPLHLAWLEPTGEISREVTVRLAGYSPGDPRWVAFAFAAGAPVPIGWVVSCGILAPISILQVHQASTYAEALGQILSFGWAALLLVLLVGCLMAWLTWRLQRKYYRPATGVWCAFVFLLGVPGFIAYWLEHRRAKLEACPACDAAVPRDREACAKCDALFPAPAPVGTEIFA